MSAVTDSIKEIVNRPKPSKCQMCVAMLRLSAADQKALNDAYDSDTMNAKQVAEVLVKHAGFTGSLRHSPQLHFREGHLR